MIIADNVPLSVFSDSKRYKQVLFNLVGNALKFTFRGHIALKITYDDEHLISEVEDTGIGMSREDLTNLFKFFG